MRTLLSIALSGFGLVSGSSVEAPSESPEIGGTVEHVAIVIDEETTPGPVSDEVPNSGTTTAAPSSVIEAVVEATDPASGTVADAVLVFSEESTPTAGADDSANSGTTTPPPSAVLEVVGEATDPVSATVADIVLEFNATSTTTIQPEASGVSTETPHFDSGASAETASDAIGGETASLPQAVDNQEALENATENLRLEIPAINDAQESVGNETNGDAAVVNEEALVVEESHEDLPDSLTAFPYVDEVSTTVAPESELSTGMII